MSNKQSLTWLHLSDLRIGAPVQRTQWFSLQRPMANDLSQLQKRFDLQLDCVLISGGLTESGSPEAFYELRQFIDKALRPMLPGGTQIFIVPGPSDATRLERIGFGLRALRNWFTQRDLEVAFFRESPEARQEIAGAFAAFAELQAGLLAQSTGWNAKSDKPYIPGDFCCSNASRRVQVVGLNSAWLQPAFQDIAALGPNAAQVGFDLNPEQLEPFSAVLQSGATPGVLLTYHAPNALHPSSRDKFFSQINSAGTPDQLRRFPLHVCASPQGEAPRVELLRSGNRLDGVILSGRGLCDTRAASDPQVGYSLGRFEGSPQSLKFSLWPRRFHSKRSVFLADQDFDELDGDQVSLTLGSAASSEDPRSGERITRGGESNPRPDPGSERGGWGSETGPSRSAPSEPARSAGKGKPSRPSVRRLLEGMLRTDSDLMAFLLDYYPEVYRRTSSGMDRTSKHNLLLQLVDTHHIVDTLQRHDPRSFERERRQLEFE